MILLLMHMQKPRDLPGFFCVAFRKLLATYGKNFGDRGILAQIRKIGDNSTLKWG